MLKSLNISIKRDELYQIKMIFLKNQINDLILDGLKDIKQLQRNTALNQLH